MQVYPPADEAHITISAAAILSEAGMKRLMDIADQVSDEPQSNSLFISGCIRRLEHVKIPRKRLDYAVAQFAIPLLIVCVRVFREVHEMVRVHFGNLAARFIRPCGGVREFVPCGRSSLIRLRAASLS
jgi:hypothetical protein